MSKVIKKPRSIFKYTKIDSYLYENLSNSQLYFNYPINLNDPYDCLIPTIFKHVSILDIKNEKRKYPELVDASPRELKEVMEKEIFESLERLKVEFSKSSGVSCFSEQNDNMLMWSHYAQDHRGVCLEFDPNSELFDKFIKVEYYEQIPKIDMLNFINSEFSVNEIIEMYSIKSYHWAYELEWRLFVEKGAQIINYSFDDLKGIYFGLRVDENEINKFKEVFSKIKMYKATLSRRKFQIHFVPI